MRTIIIAIAAFTLTAPLSFSQTASNTEQTNEASAPKKEAVITDFCYIFPNTKLLKQYLGYEDELKIPEIQAFINKYMYRKDPKTGEEKGVVHSLSSGAVVTILKRFKLGKHKIVKIKTEAGLTMYVQVKYLRSVSL